VSLRKGQMARDASCTGFPKSLSLLIPQIALITSWLNVLTPV